jgi:hypothetical protein
MLTPSERSIDNTRSAAAPEGHVPLELELDLELDNVFDELESGTFIELSPEDLDLGADAGSSS